MTDESAKPSVDNSALENSLHQAIEAPSRKSIEGFYLAFLASELIVPRRFQEKQMNNLAPFPSPFLDILAVSTGEEHYVPVFTSAEELSEWAPDEELEYLTLSGHEICKRTPDEWWLTINPAGEFGKEISPWEISHLRSGKEAMDELVSEQLRGEDPTITFEPLPDETRERIKEDLSALLSTHEALQSIYIGVHTTEESPERYIAGIVHSSSEQSPDFQEEVELALSRLFIGDIPIEAHFGKSLEESPSLALFRLTQPVVKRNVETPQKKLLARLRNFFKSAS